MPLLPIQKCCGVERCLWHQGIVDRDKGSPGLYQRQSGIEEGSLVEKLPVATVNEDMDRNAKRKGGKDIQPLQ